MKKFLKISVCVFFGVLLCYGFGRLKTDGTILLRFQEHENEENISETAKTTEQKIKKEKTKEQKTKEAIGQALETDETDQWIQEKLAGMTIEQKAAQLFVILPEALTGVKQVVRAGETSEQCYSRYPVGGIIYMADNLQNPSQTKEMLANMMAFSRKEIGVLLFLCVDEEGGRVARIASNPEFEVENVGDMRKIGDLGEVENAYEAGTKIGSYLKELGFNVDFAPVADVLTSSENSLLQDRSFGKDVQLVSSMAEASSKGLNDEGIFACAKHFPGHGGTKEDSHKGYAITDQTLEEMRKAELQPFIRQIENKIPFIMAGHISAPNVTGDQTPASLSSQILTDLLRKELHYDGIIITDALNMGAIVNHYTSAEAAVLAFHAGADMLLMPQDFKSAYEAILYEIRQGNISQERLDDSIRRILKVKSELFDKLKQDNTEEEKK